MKSPLLSLLAIAAAAVCAFAADNAAPLLLQPSRVITQPHFKGPLGPEWSVARGKWTPAEGVLTSTNIAEEKHIPVLHLATGPTDLIVDCEFRLAAGQSFLVGCDSTRHVGRVVIGAKSIKLCEDSTEVKGKSPSHTLAEAPLDLKPGDWQQLHVESTGDKLVTRLNGQELRAEHPFLATAKVRWWFAAGDQVQIRNVRFSTGTTIGK